MIYCSLSLSPVFPDLVLPVGGVVLRVSGPRSVWVLLSLLADLEWRDRRGVEGREEESGGGSGGRVEGRGRVAEEDKRGGVEEVIDGTGKEGMREEEREGVRDEGRQGGRDESEAEKEGREGGRRSMLSFPSSTPVPKHDCNN